MYETRRSEATTCKGVGKGAECQHSVLPGKAGNEAGLLARNERRVRSKDEQRRLSERRNPAGLTKKKYHPSWVVFFLVCDV